VSESLEVNRMIARISLSLYPLLMMCFKYGICVIRIVPVTCGLYNPVAKGSAKLLVWAVGL
jgi:hypothetical protein